MASFRNIEGVNPNLLKKLAEKNVKLEFLNTPDMKKRVLGGDTSMVKSVNLEQPPEKSFKIRTVTQASASTCDSLKTESSKQRPPSSQNNRAGNIDTGEDEGSPQPYMSGDNFFGETMVNPVEAEFYELNDDLDDQALATLTKCPIEVLDNVLRLELKVNLKMNTLQAIGERLSGLRELKLNDSLINSLRDIGTSFRNLEVLWLSRCSVTDLAGVSGFPKLVELYCAFNNIKTLAPLAWNRTIQMLDIEANEISDRQEVEYLANCRNLRSLSIVDNPIAHEADFRGWVLELLPALEVLDDVETAKDKDTQASPKIKKKEELSPETKNGNPLRVSTDDMRKSCAELYQQIKKYAFVEMKDVEESALAVLSQSQQLTASGSHTGALTDAKAQIENPDELDDEELIIRSVKKMKPKMPAAKKTARGSETMSHSTTRESFFASTQTQFGAKAAVSQRPQTAAERPGTASVMNLGAIALFSFADQSKMSGQAQANDAGYSELTKGDDAIFGNPLKGLMKKKDQNPTIPQSKFTLQQTNQNGESVYLPKDIEKLLDEFRVLDLEGLVDFDDEEDAGYLSDTHRNRSFTGQPREVLEDRDNGENSNGRPEDKLRRSLSLNRPKALPARDPSATGLKMPRSLRAKEGDLSVQGALSSSGTLNPLKKVGALRPKSLQTADDTAKAQGKIRKILARNELGTPDTLKKLMNFGPSQIQALLAEQPQGGASKAIKIRRNLPMIKSSVLKSIDELGGTAGLPANVAGVRLKNAI